MYVHTGKQKENKSRAIANSIGQKKSNRKQNLEIADNRPESVTKRGLQRMAKDHSTQRYQPIQKKINNTGLTDNLKSGLETLSEDVQLQNISDKPLSLQAHGYSHGADVHSEYGEKKYLQDEALHEGLLKQEKVEPSIQLEREGNVINGYGLERETNIIADNALKSQGNGTELEQVKLPKSDIKQLIRKKIDLHAQAWDTAGASKEDVQNYWKHWELDNQIKHQKTGVGMNDTSISYESQKALGPTLMDQLWSQYESILTAENVKIIPNATVNATDNHKMYNLIHYTDMVCKHLNKSIPSISYEGTARQNNIWYHSMSPAEFTAVENNYQTDIGKAYKDYDLWLGNWLPYVAGFTNDIDGVDSSQRKVFKITLDAAKMKELKAHHKRGSQDKIHDQLNVHQEGMWKGSTDTDEKASVLERSLRSGTPEPMSIGVGKNIVAKILSSATWVELDADALAREKAIYKKQEIIKQYLEANYG